jgi:hypothetical protein
MTREFEGPVLTCINPGFLIKSPGDDVDFARTQPLDSCICNTLVSIALIETETHETTYHNSEEESLVQAAILRLRRNRFQNPIELFSRRIGNAIVAKRIAGNIHHHFVRLPPTKSVSRSSLLSTRLPVNLHAEEVHPLVHSRPPIAAVAVVELVRVVALVDVSGRLEGFLRHVNRHGRVVGLGLH